MIESMTRVFLRLTGLVILAACVSTTAAHAQDWRGIGRAGGKVVDDETGKPVEGVAIKAMLPRSENRGPGEVKSNSKGEWAVGGLASGNWALDFVKDGYETRSISVPITEGGGRPPMEIRLKKKAAPPADPNVEIKAKLLDAAAKMTAKQFADARAIYEELAAKYPEVKQFRPLIARTYYGEGNKAAAIEELRKATAEDPANIEVKLLLGTTLMETGKTEEAAQILSAIDESKVTDPAVFLNIGIGLINEQEARRGSHLVRQGDRPLPAAGRRLLLSRDHPPLTREERRGEGRPAEIRVDGAARRPRAGDGEADTGDDQVGR